MEQTKQDENTNMLGRSKSAFFRRTLTMLFVLFAMLVMFRLLGWRMDFRDTFKVIVDLVPNVASETRSSRKSVELSRWIAEHREFLVLGLLQDMLFACLAAPVLACLGRWLSLVALFALTLFLASDLEHIQYNFAHIDLGMIATGLNPTFIEGSFTKDVVVAALAIAIAGLIARGLARWPWITWAFVGLSVISMLGGLIVLRPMASQDYPEWMQSNPLLPVYRVADLRDDDRAFPAASIASGGLPVKVEAHYNLLVVYLEGLSQLSLSRGDMTTMTRLGAEGIWFDNYISRNIITANGLYSTMTGASPSFLRRFIKWDELTSENPIVATALPNMLKAQGYHTAYLQSANLSFMDKETRMGMMGMDVILGDADWPAEYGRNGWGIDDMNLMAGTLDYIDTLPVDRPWFTAVLSTGTHAPYHVAGIDQPTRRDALGYADQSVAALMDGLERRGLLETTVVVLTSDEGREVEPDGAFLNDLALNRLPLVVLHPDIKGVSVPDYLLSSDMRDLALTLTQQISEPALRATLPQHKDIVFGNVITRKLFWYQLATGSLVACGTRTYDCQEWTDQKALFTSRGAADRYLRIPALKAAIETHDVAP